jgi:hypothetical protein
MFPGRIDLGLGRATAGPLLDLTLQSSRQAVATPEPYDDKVVELLHWFDGFEDGHPFARVPFLDGVVGLPETWILGSSPASAVVAARLGLPYTFSAFLNPAAARIAVATYRKEFQPSRFRGSLPPRRRFADHRQGGLGRSGPAHGSERAHDRYHHARVREKNEVIRADRGGVSDGKPGISRGRGLRSVHRPTGRRHALLMPCAVRSPCG